MFDKVQPTRDEQTGELVDLAHAVRNSYVAHLGGPEVFGELVWAEARRRHWTHARDTIVLGDGAPRIWNLAHGHVFDSRQGVDWYHATEHLAHASSLLKGEGTPAAHQWFKAQETPLFEGHADQIATQLLKAAQKHAAVMDGLRREAGYFQDNSHRMQYQELRGWLSHRQRDGRERLQPLPQTVHGSRHALESPVHRAGAPDSGCDHEPPVRSSVADGLQVAPKLKCSLTTEGSVLAQVVSQFHARQPRPRGWPPDMLCVHRG